MNSLCKGIIFDIEMNESTSNRETEKVAFQLDELIKESTFLIPVHPFEKSVHSFVYFEFIRL